MGIIKKKQYKPKLNNELRLSSYLRKREVKDSTEVRKKK